MSLEDKWTRILSLLLSRVFAGDMPHRGTLMGDDTAYDAGFLVGQGWGVALFDEGDEVAARILPPSGAVGAALSAKKPGDHYLAIQQILSAVRDRRDAQDEAAQAEQLSTVLSYLGG